MTPASSSEARTRLFVQACSSPQRSWPRRSCARSWGIWCVNCEHGVCASDRRLRIDDASMSVHVRAGSRAPAPASHSTKTSIPLALNRFTLAGVTAARVSPGGVSLRASTVTVISPGSPNSPCASPGPCDAFTSARFGCSLPAALHVFNTRKVAVTPQGSECPTQQG
jgi:hypothetical protein